MEVGVDRPSDDTGKRGFRPRVDFSNKQPGARSFVLSSEGAFIHHDGKVETLADAVDLFWAGVARDPAAWTGSTKGYDWLLAHAGDATREDVRRTLNWLEMALAKRERTAAVAATRYLAAMPAPLLAADYGRLMGIFNSRIVGMVWQVTDDLDVTPLPPRIPKLGQEAGFGLIRAVPEFYEKLAMFGPEAEELVTMLVEEAARYGVSLPSSLAAMAAPPAGPPSATG